MSVGGGGNIRGWSWGKVQACDSEAAARITSLRLKPNGSPQPRSRSKRRGVESDSPRSTAEGVELSARADRLFSERGGSGGVALSIKATSPSGPGGIPGVAVADG